MAVKTDFVRQYTWREFIQVAEDSYKVTKGKSHGNDSWAGGTHKEAFRMAKDDGYQSAVTEAEAIAKDVDDTVAAELFATSFVSTYQCAGAEVDMGRYLSGEPECMLESEPIRISRQGRAVRLAVNVSFVNSVGESVVRQRGAAVLALVDILSRAQHPLEIWACFVPASSDEHHRFVYSVCIQQANEPLDMGRVMYFLAHPTTFRRVGFSVMDTESPEIKRVYNVPGGYGTFRGGPENEIQPGDLGVDGGNTIILPLLKSNEGWSVPESIEWVKAQLAQIFGD